MKKRHKNQHKFQYVIPFCLLMFSIQCFSENDRNDSNPEYSLGTDAIANHIFANGFEFLPKINDTGVTTNSDNIDCQPSASSPQDCAHGRDRNYESFFDNNDGHAGFSFTKLDENGDELLANAATWTCVKDNLTGLIWEKKTNDGGVHDAANIYQWGGITTQGSNYGTYYDGWDELVNDSNDNNFCGYSDWHVPTITEWEDIMDFGLAQLDPSYFPSNAGSYWTASPMVFSESFAWNISLTGGIINSQHASRHSSIALRLVSSGQ